METIENDVNNEELVIEAIPEEEVEDYIWQENLKEKVEEVIEEEIKQSLWTKENKESE